MYVTPEEKHKEEETAIRLRQRQASDCEREWENEGEREWVWGGCGKKREEEGSKESKGDKKAARKMRAVMRGMIKLEFLSCIMWEMGELLESFMTPELPIW